jgi:hypothetical protein
MLKDEVSLSLYVSIVPEVPTVVKNIVIHNHHIIISLINFNIYIYVEFHENSLIFNFVKSIS